MPVYVFQCAKGHQSEVLCKSDLSDAPAFCVATDPSRYSDNATMFCGKQLFRLLTAPASIFPGAKKW